MSTRTTIPTASERNPILGELIYEYTARITHLADYGLALADPLSGAATPPLEGLRSDVSFEGPVTGPKLRGTVKGVD